MIRFGAADYPKTPRERHGAPGGIRRSRPRPHSPWFTAAGATTAGGCAASGLCSVEGGRDVKLARYALVFLKNVDAFISGLSLIALVGLTLAGVVMRYFVNRPIIWLEEIQLILFIWVAFFGSSVAFRHGSHIVIDAVVELFPVRIQRIVEIIDSVLVVLLLGFVVYIEYSRGLTLVRTGRSTNILRIPLYYNYFGVALSCLFMLVNFVVQRVGLFRSWLAERSAGGAA
jgi:TRAP-type C4-dicarboxylate transport system permease small subunit